MLDFSTELPNAELSVILLKSDYTKDALPAILKILGTNKGKTCAGVTFRYSYRWVDWSARIFKRNANKDVFLIIFQNFHNSSFPAFSRKHIFRKDFFKSV